MLEKKKSVFLIGIFFSVRFRLFSNAVIEMWCWILIFSYINILIQRGIIILVHVLSIYMVFWEQNLVHTFPAFKHFLKVKG